MSNQNSHVVISLKRPIFGDRISWKAKVLLLHFDLGREFTTLGVDAKDSVDQEIDNFDSSAAQPGIFLCYFYFISILY